MDDTDSALDSFVLATKPNYLGDPNVVSSLIRTFVGETFLNIKTIEAHHAIQGAEDLARTFLGYNPDFPGMPWNRPGQIDVFVAKALNIDETDPVVVLRTALVNLLNEMVLLKNHSDAHGLIAEQWQPAVGGLLDKYIRLFCGIPPHRPELYDLEVEDPQAPPHKPQIPNTLPNRVPDNGGFSAPAAPTP